MTKSPTKSKSELNQDEMQLAEQALTFETALGRLEQIVRQLENGELALDQAIAQFQEGMQLAKVCRDRLDQAEQKIEMLVQEAGSFQKRPFQPEE